MAGKSYRSARAVGCCPLHSSQAGELLLVSRPLGIVYADEVMEEPSTSDEQQQQQQQEEEGEDELGGAMFTQLQQQLLDKSYTLRELTWLESLCGLDPEVTAEMPIPSLESLSQLDDTHQVHPLPPSLSSQRLADILQSNILEQEEEDQQIGWAGLPLDNPAPAIYNPRAAGGNGKAGGGGSSSSSSAAASDVDLEDYEGPRGRFAGLWPELAMMQHSCSPNTVSYVSSANAAAAVTAAMAAPTMLRAQNWDAVTRMARANLPKSTELTRSYLPTPTLMAPGEVRRAALEDLHGFVCGCSRCKDESRMDPALSTLLTDLYEACGPQGGLRQDLYEAELKGQLEDIESIRDQVAAFIQLLDAAFSKMSLPVQEQTWVQAAAFDVYELFFRSMVSLGETDPYAAELLMGLCDAVAPGSETHLLWAVTHMQESELLAEDAALDAVNSGLGSNTGRRRGGGGGRVGSSGAEAEVAALAKEAEQAGQQCYRAFCSRYGPLTRRVFEKVIKQRMEREEAEESGMGMGEEELEDEGAEAL
ncbi:MAG: hypothetical protein WDW38_007442 [Sanguina aurantia]